MQSSHGLLTVLWSRKCVTCPRSVACLSLVFLVCHLPALSGSSWNLMPPGRRTPVLSLGIHLLQFLVTTPFFTFRFHQPVAWWHPLPPTPICGKSRSWPSERLPSSPFGLSRHQPFPLFYGKKTHPLSESMIDGSEAWLGGSTGSPNSCGCVSS